MLYVIKMFCVCWVIIQRADRNEKRLKSAIIIYICFRFIIPAIKYQNDPSNCLLTLELGVKRLRRFDLSSTDIDQTMIRVVDSAQMVVVAE